MPDGSRAASEGQPAADGATAGMPAAALPYHSGSPAHVATPPDQAVASPSLGAATRVRVEVPHASGYGSVHLRLVADGEPVYRPAARVHRGAAVDVYEAEVPQVNPTQRYRFQLDGPDGAAWLTANPAVFRLRFTSLRRIVTSVKFRRLTLSSNFWISL